MGKSKNRNHKIVTQSNDSNQNLTQNTSAGIIIEGVVPAMIYNTLYTEVIKLRAVQDEYIALLREKKGEVEILKQRLADAEEREK